MVRLILAAVMVAALSSAALAQPTFGRPKTTNPKDTPKTPDKKPPAPPSPPAPPPSDDAPEPDDGRMPPRGGPDLSEDFVASPDKWEEGDPPRKAPARDVEAGKTYLWRSGDGLRFSYTVPLNYRVGEGYDIVVICHPANSDFRWGMGNHAMSGEEGEAIDPSRVFRPDCIVVSLDGPGATAKAPERRNFPCTGAGAVRFRDFLLELTRTMPGKRLFIYGYGAGGDPQIGGGGGQFAVYFSGLFPALSDGVVAYGGGLPADFKIVQTNVPVVMVHGVKNALVPYSAALKAMDAEKAEGNRMVRLRSLRSFNDYPNPVRVSESMDYLMGVRTDDPAECLRAVERLMTPKPTDEYDYIAPVWYSGARELIGRILSEPGPITGEAPFEDDKAASDAVKKRARELAKLIENEAGKHVAALQAVMPKGKASDLYLDGGPWLGHLIAARDDFRGVKPMEDFAKSIGLDEAIEAHKTTAEEFLEAWSPSDEAASFAAATQAIQKCFLYEGLPVDLAARMKGWKRKALGGELQLDPEALEGFEHITNWEDGYRKGLEAYEKIWRRWRFEVKKAEAKTEEGKP